ncbi:hypothetical protein PRIPAC_89798 [Pristionchus pacificus]|uniref:Uncharacterized protein n=1 Tax=Pristionchus pacificus TaxID=54126 RepID=A0A2A6CXE6_PRIPA|nr:hypothetical protein PRIPAC_89798 [Pristionchus pacificus]|eukprot:PDM82892.1 hypothetical protein PRIPAC_37285 [Pristionchus pacificus]
MIHEWSVFTHRICCTSAPIATFYFLMMKVSISAYSVVLVCIGGMLHDWLLVNAIGLIVYSAVLAVLLTGITYHKLSYFKWEFIV